MFRDSAQEKTPWLNRCHVPDLKSLCGNRRRGRFDRVCNLFVEYAWKFGFLERLGRCNYAFNGFFSLC